MRTMGLAAIDELVAVLDGAGYEVFGPRVRDGAIVLAPISGVADLPRGVGDEQDAARYRLRDRGDDRLFGYAAAAQGLKPVLFPSDELLVRIRKTPIGFDLEEPEAPARPRAFLGARDCDLRALAVHDTVLSSREFADKSYGQRRDGVFVVAVSCADPCGTCFCVSQGGSPKPGDGYDLALTELVDDAGHRFVVEVGSERGAEVLAQVTTAEAAESDLAAVDAQVAEATASMGRTLDTEGLPELMFAAADSPHWDTVAARCLACTNCTLVCPTCFCTSVEDSTDLSMSTTERHRVWDSCFGARFSYIHGGVVRASGKSRYRQWITHKLAGYQQQFGLSGCVGCGRCITWCPAAIDITAEAAALRASLADPETDLETAGEAR
ncbi:4Fe-4S dicluster domain-containing protein [Actinotalea sp. M2MS4P-6]|uniref:4Fe-4S dicluster domain-containing protein n=1 Tax=Actinotalea sp. M2MS4P-6 TaxID=2983762 RepID=UPI0021E5048D|nr:4Fe-4S dicluster domain-containing protein [Actinotalea sp. M2MS4P-6]MCV2395879.1 4Fe-4S dicluster domain-containing protein [Actinotalea sp. M2MS4P-6]